MQSSCNASSFHAFSLPDLGLQCRLQLREMAVTLDLPQAGLGETQRTGAPALFLVRRAPVIHLVAERTELRIQGFQPVSGFQAHPSNGNSPRPWRVSVSSRPSSSLATAERLIPRSSWRSRPRAARAWHTSVARRPAGVDGARPLAESSADTARRSRAYATDSVGSGPGIRTPSEWRYAAPWPRR